MLLALLACTPKTTIEPDPVEACQDGYVRTDAGDCVPKEDTEVLDTDTDTDSDTDTDTDSDTDTDTDTTSGPVDTDGDGVPDKTDCAPKDPWVYDGAPDDNNDDIDNDCDGAVDEDFNQCSVRYGKATLTTYEVEVAKAQTVDFGFTGASLVCDWSCTDAWVTAVGLCMDSTCAEYWRFPYASGPDLLPLLATVADPGTGPGTETRCTLETSAGDIFATVRWVGP